MSTHTHVPQKSTCAHACPSYPSQQRLHTPRGEHETHTPKLPMDIYTAFIIVPKSKHTCVHALCRHSAPLTGHTASPMRVHGYCPR